MVTSALARDLLLQRRDRARAETRSVSATNRITGATLRRAGLLQEADLVGHLEEFVEGVKAEIDHLGDAVIDDQAVHQLHLADRCR